LMPVFISYTRADEETALLINHRFTSAGVSTYLDLLDPNMPAGATQAVRNGINRTTHLLAIVSLNTHGSWWVPFEIGVATQADSRIATYSINVQRSELPHYLQVWPVLQRLAHVDQYITRYKMDSAYFEAKNMPYTARQ